jgi:hypothetical protein
MSSWAGATVRPAQASAMRRLTMIRISSTAQPSSIRRVVAILGLVGMGMAQAAAPDDAPPAAAKHTATSAETPAPRSKAKAADTVSRGKTRTTLRDTRDSKDSKDTGDPLTADVLGDADLANQRGGSETRINQINATGTVSGNVASQLNTGSNTISESAFSNTAGIPIVIQNSGNNVLIQNSTILNLQLTNPK